MSSTVDRPSSLGHESAPSDRRLPDGSSKLDRLTQHTLELKDDLIAWVDLKIKLVKLEIEERIDAQKRTAAVFGTIAVLGVFGLTFLLVTIALFLGWWLGHPAWGFLVVTGLLLGLAGLLFALRGRLTAPTEMQSDVKRKSLSHQPVDDTATNDQYA
jgi:hypothetical protein